MGQIFPICPFFSETRKGKFLVIFIEKLLFEILYLTFYLNNLLEKANNLFFKSNNLIFYMKSATK